jgi:hypothetical protein
MYPAKCCGILRDADYKPAKEELVMVLRAL